MSYPLTSTKPRRIKAKDKDKAIPPPTIQIKIGLVPLSNSPSDMDLQRVYSEIVEKAQNASQEVDSLPPVCVPLGMSARGLFLILCRTSPKGWVPSGQVQRIASLAPLRRALAILNLVLLLRRHHHLLSRVLPKVLPRSRSSVLIGKAPSLIIISRPRKTLLESSCLR